MADLKQNQTYKDITDTSFKLGASLPSRFSGIPKAVSSAGQQPQQPRQPRQPQQYSGQSGAELLKGFQTTVPYGGSTRYEGFHSGSDLVSRQGTKAPIPSFTPGTVVESRTGQGKTKKPSFGNYVLIKTPDGKFVRYSHLSENYVQVGSDISIGQPVGTQGATGSVYSLHGGSGEHLDLRIYEIYQNQKKYYDPFKYLST